MSTLHANRSCRASGDSPGSPAEGNTAASATACGSLPPAGSGAAFSLLALPETCILGVFAALSPSLADSVALSQACKELWVLGAAARRR